MTIDQTVKRSKKSWETDWNAWPLYQLASSQIVIPIFPMYWTVSERIYGLPNEVVSIVEGKLKKQQCRCLQSLSPGNRRGNRRCWRTILVLARHKLAGCKQIHANLYSLSRYIHRAVNSSLHSVQLQREYLLPTFLLLFEYPRLNFSRMR